MNVIGYIRTAAGDPTGKVLDAQEEAVKKYCSEKGSHLLELFRDVGTSGLLSKRTGWFELKEFLRQNKGNIDFLVVPDMARISRDIAAGVVEIQSLRRHLGVEIIDVSLGGIDKNQTELFKQGLHRLEKRNGPKR